MQPSPHTVDPAALAAALALLLRRAGCADDIAAEVAIALVDADLSGHGTHGARQLDFYVERLQNGEVDGRARPTLELDAGSVLRVAGRRAFGQVVGDFAARVGAERALQSGVCVVCIDGSGHFGRNGRWPEIAASMGVGSLHFGQGLAGPGPVVPFGGREGRLNTNPIAFGLPGIDDETPLILDAATSAVSGSTLKQLFDQGARLDEPLLVRRDGVPSDDPADFVNGHAAVTTFGGFKGYAISVFAEILSSIVATAGSAKAATNSLFSVYFDLARFMPRQAYRNAIAAWRTRLVSVSPAGSQRVVLPGDRARTARAESSSRGLVLTADVAGRVRRAADRLLAWPDALALCPALAIGETQQKEGHASRRD